MDSQRQLYNAALQERIDAYRKRGIRRTYFDQTRGLTEWRQSDPDARTLPVKLQRATLKRLDDAYEGFFQRIRIGKVPAFPRFRGKEWFKSFAFREFDGITLHGGRIRFKGMPGSLRIHWHRPLPENLPVRSCTFKRCEKGWFVGFAIDVPTPLRRLNTAIGVDLGISAFATLSDGKVIPSLRATRNAAHRLRVAQRALSRKQRGSNGRRKARSQLLRCHAAIARQRANHLHQASANLVRKYDIIVIEALRVKALCRSALAKDVHDASWAKFIAILQCKAEKSGAKVIEVEPHNTSQECSGCRVLVPKQLGDREHHCPACGLSIGRDLNAARNILYRAEVGPGLRNVVGSDMRAGGNHRLDTDQAMTLPRYGSR